MLFQPRSWPTVILHLDGDAFFASVLQAIYPKLKDKPVVAGYERGIATAISYEAKRYGITRGMMVSEIKKRHPQVIVMSSDYETYALFSRRMYSIVREFSPTVEEYSIDEVFADLKGLRRPLKMTYQQIAEAIKSKVESSLNISVSVGVSLTKSLAKLASNANKPSGLTIVPGNQIETLLGRTKIADVWGIGPNTAAYCSKLGIHTAFDFAGKSEEFIRARFSLPFCEIWQELRGQEVYKLYTGKRTSYKSIQRTATFRPPSSNPNLLWSRLMEHIEDAFATARRYHYTAGRVSIFLKTQNFQFHTTEIKLPEQTAYPMQIVKELRLAFEYIHKGNILYRTTGCTISDLADDTATQQTLFSDHNRQTRIKKIYPLIEQKKVNFATSLFDKERIIRSKEKPKPAIPFLSLDPTHVKSA